MKNTITIAKRDGTYRRLSVCCNADVDCRGGGYEDEYIHPIEDYCKKCGQVLEINGSETKIDPNPFNLGHTKGENASAKTDHNITHRIHNGKCLDCLTP